MFLSIWHLCHVKTFLHELSLNYSRVNKWILHSLQHYRVLGRQSISSSVKYLKTTSFSFAFGMIFMDIPLDRLTGLGSLDSYMKPRLSSMFLWIDLTHLFPEWLDTLADRIIEIQLELTATRGAFPQVPWAYGKTLLTASKLELTLVTGCFSHSPITKWFTKRTGIWGSLKMWQCVFYTEKRMPSRLFGLCGNEVRDPQSNLRYVDHLFQRVQWHEENNHCMHREPEPGNKSSNDDDYLENVF